MNTLNTLVAASPATDLSALHALAADFPSLALTTETEVERVVEQMGSQAFNLLLVDKNLAAEAYSKLYRLADVLFPHAVVVGLNLADADFVRFRLEGLLADWADSQREGEWRFIEGPEGF